jgi:hypothetical protein
MASYLEKEMDTVFLLHFIFTDYKMAVMENMTYGVLLVKHSTVKH